MSITNFKGNPIKLSGSMPNVNTTAVDSTLVKGDLSEININQYHGSNVILNIFPSIDTGVCATSVRKFNEQAAALENTKVLCISNDLPFALNRFCAAEGIENVETLSSFRSDFGDAYGLTMTEGPLKGLLARSVIKIDPDGNITHTELVDDIINEPNYDAALNA